MHQYIVHSRNQGLVAATVETLIQVAAPATRRLQVVRWGISFDGISAADAPVDVDLLRQTTAGTAGAFTPLKLDEADPAALSSAQNAFTAEPTAGDILEAHQLTPLGGLLVVEYDILTRPMVAASGRVGLRANAPTAATNCTAFVVFQE